jgi:hypothetical protein
MPMHDSSPQGEPLVLQKNRTGSLAAAGSFYFSGF